MTRSRLTMRMKNFLQLFATFALCAFAAAAQQGGYTICNTFGSGVVVGSWMVNVNNCGIIDDTGTESGLVFATAPKAQLSAMSASAPTVTENYTETNWHNTVSTDTVYQVNGVCNGVTGAEGISTIAVTVGSSHPVKVVGTAGITGTMDQQFSVPAGETISVEVIARNNSTAEAYINIISKAPSQ